MNQITLSSRARVNLAVKSKVAIKILRATPFDALLLIINHKINDYGPLMLTLTLFLSSSYYNCLNYLGKVSGLRKNSTVCMVCNAKNLLDV